MNIKHPIYGTMLLLGCAMASTALAYMSPEDVLLNRELYLPPTTRETSERTARQAQESAERREREQEILFKAQHSSEAAEPEDVSALSGVYGAAPENGTESLSADDLRLLQTIRLLDRVQRNQQVVLYGNRLLPMQVDTLHGGAPLAPTGAGGMLSGLTMLGAVTWTILRARRGKVITER